MAFRKIQLNQAKVAQGLKDYESKYENVKTIDDICGQYSDKCNIIDEECKSNRSCTCSNRSCACNRRKLNSNCHMKPKCPNAENRIVSDVKLVDSTQNISLTRESCSPCNTSLPSTTLEWTKSEVPTHSVICQNVPVPSEKNVTIKTTKCIPKKKKIPIEIVNWEKKFVPCTKTIEKKVLIPCVKTITIPSHRVETRCEEVKDIKIEWVKSIKIEYEEVSDYEEVDCEEKIKVPTWKMDERKVDVCKHEVNWSCREIKNEKTVTLNKPVIKYFQAKVPVKKLVTTRKIPSSIPMNGIKFPHTQKCNIGGFTNQGFEEMQKNINSNNQSINSNIDKIEQSLENTNYGVKIQNSDSQRSVKYISRPRQHKKSFDAEPNFKSTIDNLPTARTRINKFPKDSSATEITESGVDKTSISPNSGLDKNVEGASDSKLDSKSNSSLQSDINPVITRC